MNNMMWEDFNFFYFGNILNLALSFLLIAGILIVYYYRKEIKNFEKYVFIILGAVFTLPLFAIVLINELHIEMPQGYLFNYPLSKVYIAFLFIFSECVQLFSFFVLLLIIFSYKEFSYLNSLFYSAGSIILMVLFAFLYTIGNITDVETVNKNGTYEVGVILGAAVWSDNKPSPLFEKRIEKAYELYKSKKINKILVTGGNAPGEVSEAEAAKNYLVQLGMNEKDILFESGTSTTSEQIKFIEYELAGKQGLNKILIISDQFHLKRVLEMCKFFNVKAEGIVSGYKLNWKKLLYYRVRDSIALLLFWLFAI